MKKTLSLAAVATAVNVAYFGTAIAADEGCNITGGAQSGANCAQGVGQPTSLPNQIKSITNILLLAIGIISVIMIIIGGIRFAVSGGNESGVKAAKDTILYAVVGLVIALLSFAIVNYVLTFIK